MKLKLWLKSWSKSQVLAVALLILPLVIALAYSVHRFGQARNDAWHWYNQAQKESRP